MSECLQEFAGNTSLALELAARAQHIRRWEIDRKEYPEGRSGYLRWRSTLYKFHAEQAGKILERLSYPKKELERVQFLISKKGLHYDPEARILEDVACLVFLRYYLPNFAKKHNDQKIRSILRKTWKKMSPRGKQASHDLSLPPESRQLLQQVI